MQRLQYIASFLGGFKEYLVLAALCIVSLILIFLNDNPQIRVIRSYTIGVIGVLQTAASIVPNVFALERENEILRHQNVALTDEVSRLREAYLENERLRSMLGLKQRSVYGLVPARIVGKTLDLLRNTVTLNVGENDGIKVDMPIVTESGLAGRIIATSARYAVAQLMLNRDFRASAKVQRSRVVGIVAWSGGRYVELRGVAKTQDVVVGDVIITSGYGNVFPPDVKIGVVSNVAEQEGGLFKRVEITPAVDFERLEHVFVLLRTPDEERHRLEQSVQR